MGWIPWRRTSTIVTVATLALAVPVAVSGVDWPQEATISDLKANPNEYAGRLLAVRGTAENVGQRRHLRFDLRDPTGTIGAIAVEPPDEGARGTAIGRLITGLLGDLTFSTAAWLDEGETPPDLGPELLKAFGLQDEADGYSTYCDQYLLAIPSGVEPRTGLIRVVVVGPTNTSPGLPAQVCIGVFPQFWGEAATDHEGRPMWTKTSVGGVVISPIYPDDIAAIDAEPTAMALEFRGPDTLEWRKVTAPDWLVKQIERIIAEAALGAIHPITGAVVAAMKIAEAVEQGAPGSPLGGLTLQEFENKYDIREIAVDILVCQAVAVRLPMSTTTGQWPLAWLGVSGSLQRPGAKFAGVIQVKLSGGTPPQVVDAFMNSLKAGAWDAAFTCIRLDPNADPDELRRKWLEKLQAAFERADVLSWQVLSSDDSVADTFKADVEFTVQGKRTGDTAKNRMTLELVRSDGEWKIKSIKSE